MPEESKGQVETTIGRLIIRNSDLEMLINQGSLRQLTSCRELPITTKDSFELEKIVDQILALHDGAYNREKRKLAEKYGDRDAKGNLYESQPGAFRFKNKLGLFQSAFDELLKLESEIEGTKIPINVKDLPPRLLSVDDRKALYCIIDFTTDEEANREIDKETDDGKS